MEQRIKRTKVHNLSITSKDDYTINKDDTVEIYNNTSKLEKKRSKISKDKYKVINKEGNIFKLENLTPSTDPKDPNNIIYDIIYKPRYQIRKFNFN